MLRKPAARRKGRLARGGLGDRAAVLAPRRSSNARRRGARRDDGPARWSGTTAGRRCFARMMAPARRKVRRIVNRREKRKATVGSGVGSSVESKNNVKRGTGHGARG
ncbi:hypothetical protein NX868_19825, partial [Burkholderia thailandensis]